MSDPWCWASKRALQLIRDGCEDYGTALAVYHALTEMDSDNGGTGIIKVSHKSIAQRAGCSVSTVHRRLHDLAACGAIEIETPDLKSPCKYTLRPICHHDRSFGHGERTFCHENGNPRQNTIYKEERKKENRDGYASCNPTHTAQPQKLSTPDRIGLENKLRILKDRRRNLEDDLTDFVQRQSHPDKVKELETIGAQIKATEDRLLEA